MDRCVADWIRSADSSPGSDLIVLYDYRDLALPGWLPAAMERYRTIDLAAWSLGVWAAGLAGLERIGRAVAINGTPFPVDPLRGIPPEIFRGTLDSWSEATRKRFERRMFAGLEGDERLAEVRSQRTALDQQDELRAIEAVASDGPGRAAPSWRFTKAIIGGRDLVFLPENQRMAWQGTETEEIDSMPHFPFFHLNGWAEVFA
jgi:biotin synthesis protein BioG